MGFGGGSDWLCTSYSYTVIKILVLVLIYLNFIGNNTITQPPPLVLKKEDNEVVCSFKIYVNKINTNEI